MSTDWYELKVDTTTKYHQNLAILDFKYASYFDELLARKSLIQLALKQNYQSKLDFIDRNINNHRNESIILPPEFDWDDIKPFELESVPQLPSIDSFKKDLQSSFFPLDLNNNNNNTKLKDIEIINGIKNNAQ